MKFWAGALLLLVGIALGAGSVVLGPRLAGPYIPEAFRGKVEVADGEVTRKQREADRLLLTIVTPRGAMLATFRTKIAEVDLLVAEGDTLALGLRRFEPFVDDPAILSVKKRPPGEGQPDGTAGRTP